MTDKNTKKDESPKQNYESAYFSTLELRSEFSKKQGYIREKSPIELAYHAVKKQFGEFNPNDKEAMKLNTNNNKGVEVKLPDGKTEHLKNQNELFEKVVAFNKEKGKFYDEKYIKETSPDDFKKLNDTNNFLDKARTLLLGTHQNKKDGYKEITSIEKNVNDVHQELKLIKNKGIDLEALKKPITNKELKGFPDPEFKLPADNKLLAEKLGLSVEELRNVQMRENILAYKEKEEAKKIHSENILKRGEAEIDRISDKSLVKENINTITNATIKLVQPVVSVIDRFEETKNVKSEKNTKADNIDKSSSRNEANNTNKTEQKNRTEKSTSPTDDKEEKSNDKKIKGIPSELDNRYRIEGDHEKGKYFYKDNPTEMAFRDKGDKLITKSTATSVAVSMVALAESKEWESIKLSGSKKFKQEVWMEASVRGLKVEGYEPTQQDLQNLESRQNKVERSGTNNQKTSSGKDDKSNTPNANNTSDIKKDKEYIDVGKQQPTDKLLPKPKETVTDIVHQAQAKVIVNDIKEPSWADKKVIELRDKLYQEEKNTPKQTDKSVMSETDKKVLDLQAKIDRESKITKEERAKKDEQASPERSKKDELRAAYAELSREEAIKKHPELEPLYNLEKAAKQFVNHASNKNKFDLAGKQKFIESVRNKALETIQRGQKLPELKERTIEPPTEVKSKDIQR